MANKPKTTVHQGPKIGSREQFDSLFSKHVTHYSSEDRTLGDLHPTSDEDFIDGRVKQAEGVLRRKWPDLPDLLLQVVWWKGEDRWEYLPEGAGLDDFKPGARFEGAHCAMGFTLYPTSPATIEGFAIDVVVKAWQLQIAFENKNLEDVRSTALRFEEAWWRMFIKHDLELPYRVGQDNLNKIPKMAGGRKVKVATSEEEKQEQERAAMAECLRVNDYLTRRLNRQPGLEKIMREAGKNIGVKSLTTMRNRTRGLREMLGRPAARR